jgi:hypothetical protein
VVEFDVDMVAMKEAMLAVTAAIQHLVSFHVSQLCDRPHLWQHYWTRANKSGGNESHHDVR